MFKVRIKKNLEHGVFIVNFEHISHFFLVILLLALSKQIPAELYIKWPVYVEVNDGKTDR